MASKEKMQAGYRESPEIVGLLDGLAEIHGCSRNDEVRRAVRNHLKAAKIRLPHEVASEEAPVPTH